MWFKVDDNLAFHPKVIASGNPAMGLWVRAGSWCGQQLTDGWVPARMVGALDGDDEAVERLVGSGLWVPDRGGFQFHEWTEGGRQPTRAEVEGRREDDRKRKAAARAERARRRREQQIGDTA